MQHEALSTSVGLPVLLDENLLDEYMRDWIDDTRDAPMAILNHGITDDFITENADIIYTFTGTINYVDNKQSHQLYSLHSNPSPTYPPGGPVVCNMMISTDNYPALCNAYAKDRFDAPMSLEETNDVRNEIILATRKAAMSQQINRSRLQNRYMLSAVDLSCFKNRAMGLFETIADAMAEATSTQSEKLMIVEMEQTENSTYDEEGPTHAMAFIAASIDRSVDGSKLRLSTARKTMELRWADDLTETIEFGPNKFSTHYTMESKVGERTTFKTVIVDKQLNNLRPPTDELWKKEPLF